jgi:hypothetical protein
LIFELSRAQSPSHCYRKFDFGAFTGTKSLSLLPQIRFWILHGHKEPLIVTANSILEPSRAQRASHCYLKFDFGSFTGTKSPSLLPQIRFWILHGHKEPLIVTANSILELSRAQRAPHCYRKFDFGAFTGTKSPSLLPQIRFWSLHGHKEPLIVTANSILELSRAQRAPHCYRKFDFGAFTGTKTPSLLPQIRFWSFHGHKEPLIVTANSILEPSWAQRASHCYRKFDFGAFTGYNACFTVRLGANCDRKFYE